jgi:hypothetical protein
VRPAVLMDGRDLLRLPRPANVFVRDSWARHACAVAGRTLTRTEWQDALPERDYALAPSRVVKL